MRHYAPNTEPDMLLECGHVETMAFAMWNISAQPARWTKGPNRGKKVWWQSCPFGHGLQRIIRPATPADRIANEQAANGRLF
jgi:hypothetical protein